MQPFLDLARQRIKQFVLFFLRECRQDMIKQGCGGADEFTGALFHGQISSILSHWVGHLWGECKKIAAETILQIKAPSSSFLSISMLSKHPLDGPV